jgi:O-antigen ligase
VAASTLPLTTRIALAAALVAPFCTLALWLRRPDVIVGGYVFALPLLEQRDLPYGFQPAELATAAVVAVGAMSAIAGRRSRIPARLALILWTLAGLAIVGMIAGVANGVMDREQLANSVLKPISWIFAIYLVIVYFDSALKLRRLVLIMALSAAVVGVTAIAQVATGAATTSAGGDVARADGTFETYNQLGGFMALMALPTLGYAFASRKGPLKALLFGAFVVQLAALLLSGTLGSMLGVLVAGVVSVRIWGVRPVMGLAVTAAPFVAVASVALLAPAQAGRVHLLSNRAEDRLGTYAAGIAVAKDHLWLGTGSIGRAVEELRSNSKYHSTRFGLVEAQPHNVFLEQFVVTGIIGMVLLLWLVWLAIRVLLSSIPSPSEDDYILRWGILLGAIAFLVQNLTNNLLSHARLGLMFLLLVTIAAQLREVRGGLQERRRGDAAGGIRAASAVST